MENKSLENVHLHKDQLIGHLDIIEDLKPTFNESEEIIQHPPPSVEVVNVIEPMPEIAL